jgi:hypothetical protein
MLPFCGNYVSPPPDLASVEQALASFKTDMTILRRDSVTRDLPAEAVERVFSLSSGFEQIGCNLSELAGRVRELAEERRPQPVTGIATAAYPKRAIGIPASSRRGSRRL